MENIIQDVWKKKPLNRNLSRNLKNISIKGGILIRTLCIIVNQELKIFLLCFSIKPFDQKSGFFIRIKYNFRNAIPDEWLKVAPGEKTWKKSFFYFDKERQKNYCACEIAMF